MLLKGCQTVQLDVTHVMTHRLIGLCMLMRGPLKSKRCTYMFHSSHKNETSAAGSAGRGGGLLPVGVRSRGHALELADLEGVQGGGQLLLAPQCLPCSRLVPARRLQQPSNNALCSS